MNEETIHELIEREAFAIWQAKERLGMFSTPEINWLEAERKIRANDVSDVLSISVHNRLEKYF